MPYPQLLLSSQIPRGGSYQIRMLSSRGQLDYAAARSRTPLERRCVSSGANSITAGPRRPSSRFRSPGHLVAGESPARRVHHLDRDEVTNPVASHLQPQHDPGRQERGTCRFPPDRSEPDSLSRLSTRDRQILEGGPRDRGGSEIEFVHGLGDRRYRGASPYGRHYFWEAVPLSPYLLTGRRL